MKNLIITVNNYSSGVNNQVYSTGGNYACNYPVYQGWTGHLIDSVAGDDILIADGGFLDLIAGGYENGNMPAYRYVVCETGEIFEIDYIIDDTHAKLKHEAAYTNSSMVGYVVDYLAQPVVANTSLMDIASGAFGVPGVQCRFVQGPVALDISADYDTLVGSDPFLIDLPDTGAASVAINIFFETYNT